MTESIYISYTQTVWTNMWYCWLAIGGAYINCIAANVEALYVRVYQNPLHKQKHMVRKLRRLIGLRPYTHNLTSMWFGLGTTFPLNFQHKQSSPHTWANLYTIWTRSDIGVGIRFAGKSHELRRSHRLSIASCVLYVEISGKLSRMNVAKILRKF